MLAPDLMRVKKNEENIRGERRLRRQKVITENTKVKIDNFKKKQIAYVTSLNKTVQ